MKLRIRWNEGPYRLKAWHNAVWESYGWFVVIGPIVISYSNQGDKL